MFLLSRHHKHHAAKSPADPRSFFIPKKTLSAVNFCAQLTRTCQNFKVEYLDNSQNVLQLCRLICRTGLKVTQRNSPSASTYGSMAIGVFRLHVCSQLSEQAAKKSQIYAEILEAVTYHWHSTHKSTWLCTEQSIAVSWRNEISISLCVKCYI